MRIDRVYLIGLSGTGKTSVAPLVAERLGFQSLDLDREIERVCGMSVPKIFATVGEPAFRAIERTQLALASRCSGCVVATGGGVVLDEANWVAMRPRSAIIHLSADATTLLERLTAAVGIDPPSERPLLAGDDPAARLQALWQQRRTLYAQADAEVNTTAKCLDDVADEIAQTVRDIEHAGLTPLTSLAVSTGRSDLYVNPGLIDRAGTIVRRRWPAARRAWVISDDNVGPLWGEHVGRSLAEHGFQVLTRSVKPGEASKSLAEVGALLDWLLGGHIDRRDVVVALGGGVVGDLAGFVAAIVLRGVGLVQIPTSLLAMVDSSIGGKTGIDHGRGKNLIGAFYQPPLVIADPSVLATLPERELRAGWAEIAKHAMIECSVPGRDQPTLLRRIDAMSDLLSLEDIEAVAEIVRHNILLKAAVVQVDERESGVRRLLNYGHTLGHAMEAAGYRYLHGEAIALGMRAAARLAQRRGLCDQALVEHQDALLDRLGLPRRFEGRLSAVLDHLVFDKKAVHGALTWILPVTPGTVRVVSDVPSDDVEAVARELGAT